MSIRYTERLAEAGVVTSVGTRSDSYNNALAESVIGLDKTELVRGQGPWRSLDDLELATLEWVDWFNHRRLFNALGHVPPAEYEEDCYSSHVLAKAEHLNKPSLHETRGVHSLRADSKCTGRQLVRNWRRYGRGCLCHRGACTNAGRRQACGGARTVLLMLAQLRPPPRWHDRYAVRRGVP